LLMSYSYRTLVDALSSAGIDDAAEEAMLILERFCGVGRSAVYCDRDRVYASPALDAAVAKRLERYPLQYILGTWDFFALSFEVSPDCLIPRPDTEILVEQAIRRIPPHARAVDLCTGSGCIAVSVLKNRPDVTVTALELYSNTLRLATRNAERNGVSNRFTPLQADLLSDGIEKLAENAPYDAILSNPPYIPTETVRGLSPEVGHEPAAALDGGADGLVFYRAILEHYAPMVRPGSVIILEIGYDQGDALRRLAERYIPRATFETIELIRDLGGRDRVVILRLPV